MICGNSLRRYALLVTFGLWSGLAISAFSPSEKTLGDNARVLQTLPFSDKQLFDDAKRGFIAPLPHLGVVKKEGKLIWNLPQYNFIKPEAPAPDTVNPSLWRQSQLLMFNGLFKVVEGVYQVRSIDLSNITFIEAPDGLIVVDPLVSAETASAALALYRAYRPAQEVKAVIFTHSHIDHYGGVEGVVSASDVKEGKVKIYAPKGFVESALSENVIVGNVMSRRATYMYGNLLPASGTGQIGSGLGLTTSSGTVTYLNPTDVIKSDNETRLIAGLKFEFLLAKGSEAPAEMHFYIPKYKALTMGENASDTMHNLYSLRGAKVRDARAWARYLNASIDKWGERAEVCYGMHNWPVWGQEKVVDYLKKQRDVYKYIHDQTLRLANKGYDMTEIAERIQLPKSLNENWATRGYYGSLNHNIKAVYNFYLGWFNGNPATLNPLPRVPASKKYVEFMGGSAKVLDMAEQSYEKGEYRWVAQVVNHVIYAEPYNKRARTLQAKALSQMAYVAESGPWRNFYLSAAQELQHGVKKDAAPETVSPATLSAMPMGILFDYMAVKLDGKKAAGKIISVNWHFTDSDERYLLTVENAVMNYSANKQSADADVSLTLSRSVLNDMLLKKSKLAEKVQKGEVIFEGDEAKFFELLYLLEDFNFWFNLVTPIRTF